MTYRVVVVVVAVVLLLFSCGFNLFVLSLLKTCARLNRFMKCVIKMSVDFIDEVRCST